MDNNLQNNRNLARSPNIYLDNEYSDWILELKQRYKNAQLKTAVKVNSELLLFNWLLGKDLVSRKFEENGEMESLNKSAMIFKLLSLMRKVFLLEIYGL